MSSFLLQLIKTLLSTSPDYQRNQKVNNPADSKTITQLQKYADQLKIFWSKFKWSVIENIQRS